MELCGVTSDENSNKADEAEHEKNVSTGELVEI